MPTKKVATKVAPKSTKAPAKSSPKKKIAAEKPELVQASSEQCFWTTDGRIIANLVELSDALASMNDDVFTYHVTKERNDFAEWIEHVLLDAELATAVRKSKKPNTAREVVVSRLRIYSI